MSERATHVRGGMTAPGRLHGVDLARGLAVLGMFASHLLVIDDFDWAQPATWIDVVNGRSSILFAVLAGVSIALVTGGIHPAAGDALRQARGRLAARAVLVWLIGVALIATGVPVFVILPAYGILFLLALPLLALRARTLWIVAGATALVMPWVQPALDAAVTGAGGDGVSLLVGWHYPFTVWAAFVVAGMAAGRSDLRAVRTQVALLVGGAAAAIAGYAMDAATGASHLDEQSSYLGAVWTARAHSSGLLEVVASGGFALAALGACLLLCRTPVTWIVLPLRAVGSMPLTAYVGQLLAWALAASLLLDEVGDLTGFRALQPFWPFVVTTLVGCTVWALLVGRGPLERALDRLVRLAVPARPDTSSPPPPIG